MGVGPVTEGSASSSLSTSSSREPTRIASGLPWSDDDGLFEGDSRTLMGHGFSLLK